MGGQVEQRKAPMPKSLRFGSPTFGAVLVILGFIAFAVDVSTRYMGLALLAGGFWLLRGVVRKLATMGRMLPGEPAELEKARLLLKDNPELVKGKNGWTPLHEAAAKGYEGVAELLLANEAEVNAKDNRGMTPLGVSARRNVAELLIVNKAEVNVRANDGTTPLHHAASSGRKDVVELLLANKAEINTKDNRGRTPLHEAASSGHKDVVELLLGL